MTLPAPVAAPTATVRGLRHPTFLYGTAWKEDETRTLVEQAVHLGFRGIDTANQRRHYHEAAVGEALAAVLAKRLVTREELFLQTKFTFVDGQDHRLPYDPRASIAVQVRQSFESSLSHLGTTYLDSYLLHGPSRRSGLGGADWEAWRAMEELAAGGLTRALGVSNVSSEQLLALLADASVRPSFVQNRCHASRGWDREVRAICAAHEVRYQGFSLLTANPDALRSKEVRALATKLTRTPPQIVFRLALQLGILPLTGSSDPVHLQEDLDVHSFSLEDADVDRLERLVA